MANLRRPVVVTAALTATLLLAGCGPSSTEVDGSKIPRPPGAPSASSSATAGARAKLTSPLTVKDLPGWKRTDVAAKFQGDWVHGCGRSAGAAKLQKSAASSSLTRDGGVSVVSRVATYGQGGAAKAVAAVGELFTDCAIEDVPGGGQVVFSTQTSPVDQPAAGALITATDSSGHTDTAAYWIVAVGDSTVEVYTHAAFTRTSATDPMTTFSAAVVKAAVSKATGHTVPPVDVPATATTVATGSGDQDPGSDTGGETGPSTTFGTGEPDDTGGR